MVEISLTDDKIADTYMVLQKEARKIHNGVCMQQGKLQANGNENETGKITWANYEAVGLRRFDNHTAYQKQKSCEHRGLPLCRASENGTGNRW